MHAINQIKNSLYTKPRFWSAIGTILFLLFLSFYARPTHAAGTWDQDFENCTGATTCTDWTDDGNATVTLNSTAQPHGGTKSFLTNKTGASATGTTYTPSGGDTIANGDIFTIWVYKSQNTGGAGTRTEIRLRNSTTNRCNISLYDGNVYDSGSVDRGDYTINTWTQIDIQPTSTSGGQCRLRVNEGSWSAEFANGGTTSDANNLRIINFGATTYLDDVIVDSYADPRTNPTCSESGGMLSTYQLDSVQYIHPTCITNVGSQLYPSSTGTADFRLYQNTVHVASWSIDLTELCPAITSPVNDPYCSTLFPDWQFVPGDYSYDARACFDGYSCGSYMTPFEFTVTPYNFGTGEISGDIESLWGGGYTDWNDFITAYPDHDTMMGACNTTANPLTWLECVWSYVVYAIWPDSDSFSNVVSTPLGVLLTRWPVAYLSVPVDAFYSGLTTSDRECNVPVILNTTILGNSVAGFSLCTAFAGVDVASEVEGNSTIETIFLACIWFFFATLWFSMAKRFLHA